MVAEGRMAKTSIWMVLRNDVTAISKSFNSPHGDLSIMELVQP